MKLGIGLIGTGWMARAHVHAMRSLRHLVPSAPDVRLIGVASSNTERAALAARKWGFAEAADDWRRIVEHPDVDVVVNAAGNLLHTEPSVRALEADKAVLCEKPLAVDAETAWRMAAVAAQAARPAACAFNYRFVPAIRLLRGLLSRGELGSITQCRVAFLQDWAAGPDVPYSWRFSRAESGAGAIGDYAHAIDLIRHLVDEPTSVSAETVTFTPARPHPDGRGTAPVDVDDAYVAAVRLRGGGLASLEGSRAARGRKAYLHLEVYGTAGACWWNLEDLNRLHVDTAEPGGRLGAGFRDVMVTEQNHPFMEHWWAPGHILGWEHAVTHQWLSFLDAVRTGDLGLLASFIDGAQAATVTDAVLAAATDGARVQVPAPQEVMT